MMLKHKGCGGEMMPFAVTRSKSGSVRYLKICEKCGRIYAYREEAQRGAKVLKCEGERTYKVCEVCGAEFWGKRSGVTCSIACGRKRANHLTALKNAEKRAVPPPKPSLSDFSAACKKYRERTGQYLTYRDFQSGNY